MPTKKNTKKARVSKQAKKSKFQFKWWMGVVIIAIVIIVGVVVVRFSFAGTSYTVKIDDANGDPKTANKYYLTLYNQGASERGSITYFRSTPYYTEWRMHLNNGLEACGRLYNNGVKDIPHPALPTTALWTVTNPSCVNN